MKLMLRRRGLKETASHSVRDALIDSRLHVNMKRQSVSLALSSVHLSVSYMLLTLDSASSRLAVTPVSSFYAKLG